MFCPVCGRALTGPARPVAFPMHVCAVDGVVYDARRGRWYGLPAVEDRLHCPACGEGMEPQPPEPPVLLFVCYQCGVTYDRGKAQWYGVSYHLPPADAPGRFA